MCNNLGATPSFHRLLSRLVTPRDPLGISCGPLGTPGTPCGRLGDPWESLGDPVGIPRGPLGDHLETFGEVLGSFGDALAIPWGPLRCFFGYLRCLLDILWGQLGAPRDSQRLPKWVREASWGPLGIILEASKACTKRFAATCKNLQIYCKVLQNSRFEETEIVENLM